MDSNEIQQKTLSEEYSYQMNFNGILTEHIIEMSQPEKKTMYT